MVDLLARAVVPLQQRDGRIAGRPQFEIESGSVTGAVGALYLSPGDGNEVMFAEALVHESFHQLLNAAIVVVNFALTDEAAMTSPFKPEPRPPIAVLHGIVAFGAVRRFWQRMAALRPEWELHGMAEVARRSEQINCACATLMDSDVLTRTGEAVVTAAQAQLAGSVHSSPRVSVGGRGENIEFSSKSGVDDLTSSVTRAAGHTSYPGSASVKGLESMEDPNTIE